MSKHKIAKNSTVPKSAAVKTLAAAAVYSAMSLYIYHPYLNNFQKADYIFIAGSVFGSLGCFVLSRRWISSPVASLFAGAIYGFCPFTLWFSAYHPFSIIPMASIPWLFCIAAFLRHHTVKKKSLLEITGIVVLTLLPFAAIALFFWMCAQPWWIRGPFFPIPKSETLHLSNFAGFMTPLSTEHNFSFAFYHVPVAAMLMGACMYAAARRFAVLGLVLLGFALAFLDTFTHVSPVVWAIVPVLFCSILSGIGMQGLDFAGSSDTKWILIPAVIMLILAGICAVTIRSQNAYYSARMFALSATVLGIIACLARAKLRLHTLRWLLLSIAMGIDIVLGAVYMIDKIL